MEKTKVCPKCGRELPVSDFYRNRSTKDGLDYCCKECARKARRENSNKQHVIPQQGVKATFKISDFEDNMLFAELRRRGYTGELRFSKVVSI